MANTFNGIEILKLNNIEDKFLIKSMVQLTELKEKVCSRRILRNAAACNQDFGLCGIGYCVDIPRHINAAGPYTWNGWIYLSALQFHQ